MTISKDLFLSILAMDAYNRGYNSGISDGGENDPDGLGEVGQIGSTTISTISTRTDLGIGDDEYQQWQDAGFYAIAYSITDPSGITDWGGETTVISYRGTDSVLQEGGSLHRIPPRRAA